MSPRQEALSLLGELQARGVELRADGDRILFRPVSLVASEDRERLALHKAALLALLGTPDLDLTLDALCACLPPAEALGLREERAAILEHEAGLPRAEAERRAGLRTLEDA